MGSKSEEQVIVDAPYLERAAYGTKKYTLVLDLYETLVHYFESGN